MAWNAVAGATFRIEDGPLGQKHPYFVLNNPMPLAGYGDKSCVVVNASTPGRYVDRTCILPAGCHPSIRHESFVYFGKARVFQVNVLEKNVNSRVYSPGPQADIKLVKFIVSFMHEAEELADDIKDFALHIEAQLNALKTS